MKKSLAWVMTIIMALTVFSICQTDMTYAATKVISLNLTNVGDTYTLQKGKTKKLKYSIQATKKKYKKVKWKSSNKKVVTVSSKGKIKGKKNGVAWITVYAKSKKKIKDKVLIRVGTPVSSIGMGGSTYYVRAEKDCTINKTIYPSSASNKVLNWRSSNPSVATVDQNGVVSGIKKGVVTVSAQATDGWGAIGKTTVKVVHLLKEDAVFIAHRGYSAYYPENTIPAFTQAAQYDFDGCEMDVWESRYTVEKDEEPGTEPEETGQVEQQNDEPEPVETEERFDLMIMHNENIKAMCGVSKNITDVNTTNRDNYPVIKGNDRDKVLPTYIPTLDEALETIHQENLKTGHNTEPVIELKANEYSQDAIEKIMDLIAENGGKATIISFNKTALNQAQKAIDSGEWQVEVGTQYLKSSASRSDVDTCVKNGYSGISVGYNNITKDLATYAHSKGLVVASWTLPSQTEAARVIDLGADRVTSNYRIFFDD